MELPIEQALQQGVAAHKEGKVQDAEKLYRAILQSQPLHPDANHNLGVLAVSVNKADLALPLFKTALEANPKIEQFWLSYIDALIKEKQFENAKQVFEQAKTQGMAGDKLNVLETQLTPTAQVNEPKLAVQNKNLSFSQKRKKPSKKKNIKKEAKKQNLKANNPSQQQLNSLLEHYQNGRFSDAEKLAMHITQAFPKHQFAWKVLGAVLGATGRKSEAENANQTSVALSPQDPEAHYNLGNTFKELGRLDEALASYTQAIALKPDFAEAHYNLGNTLKELGRLDEAVARHSQAIALKPDYTEAHSDLGITLNELGRLGEAEASLRQAIELEPDYAEAHSNLGITLQELGRLDEALASYAQATVLKPDFAGAHYNLSNTLKELGRLDEALASYTQAIVLRPDFVEAYSNLGITLKELGRLDEALASYTQAIVLKPDFAEAYSNLGNSLQGLGRLDEAVARYSQAIALKPDYAEAHSNLGITLNELGRLGEAEASLRKAIALKPDYAEAHRNLGITLNELGRLHEAEASYTQALVLRPDYALAHYGLSKVLYNMSYKDSALESLKRANAIDPNSKDISLLLSVLQARKAREYTEVGAKNIITSNCPPIPHSIILELNKAVEQELTTYLYTRKLLDLDKEKDPSFGDTRGSKYDLFEDNHPIIQNLASDLNNILMETFNSDVFIKESFFSIFSAGGGTARHRHLEKNDKDSTFSLAKQKYSLVYYLSVGDQDCTEPGILKFYDPSQEILPSKGLIIIFPADRYHSSFYGGNKDRVIVGVNFYTL